MSRTKVRRATTKDLDLLVRHRRLMWEAIHEFPIRELDDGDATYRRWVRARMRSNRLVGFIVEVDTVSVASGCVWLVPVQPRPGQQGTTAAYILSMFTEPDQRGRGHASRIVREAMRWARSCGVSLVALHASEFGESVYRRLGFRRTREMRREIGPFARPRARPRKRARPRAR